MKRTMMILALLALSYAGSGKVSNASQSSGPPRIKNSDSVTAQATLSLYDQGVAAGNSGDYAKAIDLFQQALKADPDNPDILNMLAHAQRKSGPMDDVLMDAAMDNYWKALKIRPNFPEAREYLGEAYLQGLLKQAILLKGYGAGGKEQLKALIEAFDEVGKQIKDSK
ncbi:MAG TPA: tetratricopeptide repeat protein [bacterium]|jgi:tetratricopeptide (TPR) repeat protein|nr:tetratricopeptide repeat protein [bacterium]